MFEEMLVRDPTTSLIINKVRQKSVVDPNLAQIMTKIKYTKVAMKSWNKTHFDHVQSKITSLKTYIESLQSQHPSNYTLEQEEIVFKELDELLLRERLLWVANVKMK